MIVFLGTSSLLVGPRKYPWSTASMTERPFSGLMILDILFFKPQSIMSHLHDSTPSMESSG